MKRNLKAPIVQTYLAILAAVLIIQGCASLQPGADPVVVRAEQGLTVAPTTFDAVLALEYANVSFWKQNAPEFYHFCEQLKKPIPYNSLEYGVTNVPACIAAQMQLDDAKNAYKASKSQTNALFSAQAALDSLLGSSKTWLLLLNTNNLVKAP